jgi:glutamate carboxypeptidase
MKGGLAVMLISLLALERSPYAENIGWQVLINPDEEVGSLSSAHLFEQAAKKCQVGLIFEPAFSDGAFVSGRKGSASYTVIARGKAAHSGRDFSQGRSAIYAIAHYMNILETMNHPESGFTVNVGFIEGGGPVNIVPDFALCKVNIRSSDPDKMKGFLQVLEDIAVQCRQRDGIQIEITQDTLRLPKPFDEKTQKLFKDFEACAKNLHIPFQLRESGGVCDGNILSAAGLPTIDSLGVVGGQIHTHDEFIHLPSLIQRAQLTTQYLLKLASQEEIYV